MAKRKKNKKPGVKEAEPCGSLKTDAGYDPKPPKVPFGNGASLDITQLKVKKSPVDSQECGPMPGKAGCRVSLPTFIGGMFLTLVLGMYLGTLLPGILEEKGGKPVAVAPAAPQAQQKPKSQGMDEHLRHTIADLEKKAANNPDSAPDWINLGNIYFDAKMPDRAIQAYKRALELAPGNADVLTDMGIMHREKGDFARAVEAFRKAIAIDPHHQNAMFNEGIVLLNDMHDKAGAAAAWQRLLDVNPEAKAPNGAPLTEMIRQLH